MVCCAGCGKSGDGLKKCTACKLVWYCDVDCQRAHRKTHRKLCKERETELKASALSGALLTGMSLLAGADDSAEEDSTDLFAPDPPREECPICAVPLPLDQTLLTYAACCSKDVCGACIHENQRVIYEENVKRSSSDPPRQLLDSCCPFCREPTARTEEQILERVRKRMLLNDARAINNMAYRYQVGSSGLPQDHRKALELSRRAAELGSLHACYNIAVNYRDGVVVEKDRSKERHYLQIAAKGGVVSARVNLGVLENKRGNFVLAHRHWLIAAAAGHSRAMDNVKKGHLAGLVTEEEYENALRANKKAHDETKSDERDKYAAHKAAGGKPYPALSYGASGLTPP